MQEWEEMECRLQYLEAQAQEAAAALARKHNEQARAQTGVASRVGGISTNVGLRKCSVRCTLRTACSVGSIVINGCHIPR